MSMINVEINTIDEDMIVKIDGKVLKDVCSITACADGCMNYGNGKDLYLSISCHSKNEDESLKMMNIVTTAADQSGKLVKKQVSADKIKKGALPTNVMVNEME